ncbi:MAG: Txe/YoeB family addiction module toxin [Bacteroidetes bacterium]|nr:Txe/YoeB family addiction module toxin [Bacteroidota bacterium]
MSWRIIFSSQTRKDAKKLASPNLRPKAEVLLEILREDPYRSSPPFERLVGDLKGTCSRRINIQHRLVYKVYDKERMVKVLRMWSHYE